MKTLKQILVCLGWMVCGAVLAQTAFPAKPVDIVVPFPPGGAADQPSRLSSQAMIHVWKQPAVVLTRPGAGGAIGSAAVANAAADGCTLLATNPSRLILPEADRFFGRTHNATFDSARAGKPMGFAGTFAKLDAYLLGLQS